MRVYVVCADEYLNQRWLNALGTIQPRSSRQITSDMEYNAIVFLDDEILKELSDTEQKKLFLHRVMVLSRIPDFIEAQEFLHLGAMGYGNAMMHESHLVSAYHALEEGKIWLHPDFITLMITQIQKGQNGKAKSLSVLDVLSPREREVALMLGEGSTHQEIADTLDITVRTVKAHASAIYQKLSVKDRLALSLLLHS